MKLSNPRLIRTGGLVGGAIVEQGDGELILPPVLQQTVEIGDPIARVYGSAQALPTGANQTEQSFCKSGFVSVVGAGGGSSNQLAFPGKGVWRFDWTACHGFFGTNNAAVKSYFGMQDVDVNVTEVCSFPNIGPTQSQQNGSFTISLERRDSAALYTLLFLVTSAATVALDGLFINGWVYGKRLM